MTIDSFWCADVLPGCFDAADATAPTGSDDEELDISISPLVAGMRLPMWIRCMLSCALRFRYRFMASRLKGQSNRRKENPSAASNNTSSLRSCTIVRMLTWDLDVTHLTCMSLSVHI